MLIPNEPLKAELDSLKAELVAMKQEAVQASSKNSELQADQLQVRLQLGVLRQALAGALLKQDFSQEELASGGIRKSSE